MSQAIRSPHGTRNPRVRARITLRMAGVAGLVCALVGCANPGEVDGWLFDQSTVGRWENTPTIVPILERIEVLERDEGETAEITQVTSEDLIPVVEEYQLGPGDQLKVSILDFLQQGFVSEFELQVDITGALDMPQLGRVFVQGQTAEEARDTISKAVVDKGISIEQPVVSMQLLSLRQATFSVYGAIQGVGRYSIPAPDYRLLEALTEAGGISPTLRKVQVIRQVILSAELKKGAGAKATSSTTTRPAETPKQSGTDLNSLIEELTAPADAPTPAPPAQPAPALTPSSEPKSGTAAEAPPIDLVEGDAPSKTGAPPTGDSSWVYLNGEWVQVGKGGKPGAGAASGADSKSLVTQRIIEIPVGPLLKGLAQYNIVVRPGDVISIPPPDAGLVYLAGPGIGRPGVYELPQVGRLTIKQAVAAAGGLSAVAIPERLDLTRRIGDDREATIRLNLRAIFEGTQPDVFVKPEDQLNFGTNFFATPLAIIRNGFRMTYGFGFLMDRNFGNDIFGPPPLNRIGQ